MLNVFLGASSISFISFCVFVIYFLWKYMLDSEEKIEELEKKVKMIEFRQDYQERDRFKNIKCVIRDIEKEKFSALWLDMDLLRLMQYYEDRDKRSKKENQYHDMRMST